MKKHTLSCFLLAFFLNIGSTFGQLVLEYDIFSTNTKITLPLWGSVLATVDWGDGSPKESFYSTGDRNHVYTSTGKKTVTVTGEVGNFGSFTNANNSRLIRVLSWNNVKITSFEHAFYYAENLISVPTTLPNTVTDISYMFAGASSFNQPLNTWDTKNVSSFKGTFMGATSFNQPIGTWNTQSMKEIYAMFSGATSFNQDISAWNTQSVSNFGAVFLDASSFNQPIGNWNTNSVILMFDMFNGAKTFNQYIGNWNTSKVTNMNTLFKNATSFNQNLGKWNVSAMKSGNDMFLNAKLCTENYDSLLVGWSAQTLTTGIRFNGGMSKYSNSSVTARSQIVSKGWTVADAGIDTDGKNACSTPTSILDIQFVGLSGISPNPVKDVLKIGFSFNPSDRYTICNSHGQLVAENAWLGQDINLSSLPQGAYILKLQNADKTHVFRFLKAE